MRFLVRISRSFNYQKQINLFRFRSECDSKYNDQNVNKKSAVWVLTLLLLQFYNYYPPVFSCFTTTEPSHLFSIICLSCRASSEVKWSGTEEKGKSAKIFLSWIYTIINWWMSITYKYGILYSMVDVASFYPSQNWYTHRKLLNLTYLSPFRNHESCSYLYNWI